MQETLGITQNRQRAVTMAVDALNCIHVRAHSKHTGVHMGSSPYDIQLQSISELLYVKRFHIHTVKV